MNQAATVNHQRGFFSYSNFRQKRLSLSGDHRSQKMLFLCCSCHIQMLISQQTYSLLKVTFNPKFAHNFRAFSNSL